MKNANQSVKKGGARGKKPRSNHTRKRKVSSISIPQSYPWKILSKVLMDVKDSISTDAYKLVAMITRHRDIDAYLLLGEAWGLQRKSPAEIDTEEFRALYLLSSILKKFQFETSRDDRVAATKKSFFAAEASCAEYNAHGYEELVRPENSELLLWARRFLSNLLGEELPHHEELLKHARHGPGATLDTKRGQVSSYYKFANWPYSCTSDAYRYARFLIESDTRWLGALLHDYRERYCIPQYYPIDMKVFWTRVIKITDRNWLTFVPKNSQKERTIAIEPTLNLYLQLGVDGFIRARLKRRGFDLSKQEKNQEMARIGSLNWPDERRSYATIDLKAASDKISLKICELLLPADWYNYLVALRSPTGELDGEIISYEKISSMGNGYTFVLESALFAALSYAAMKVDGAPTDRRALTVYGDDIVVRKTSYRSVVNALRLAGFTVNTEKTFSEGWFRESCGADWFHGKPVRPIFLTDYPRDVRDLFLDHNRLKRWFDLYYGYEELEVLKQISKWVPTKEKLIVGPYSDEDFDSYIHCATPPQGARGKDGMYKYTRLIARPRKMAGNKFLFRKLMHRLEKVVPPTSIFQANARKARRLAGSGSRFAVVNRNGFTVGYTYSVTEKWSTSYTVPWPPSLE